MFFSMVYDIKTSYNDEVNGVKTPIVSNFRFGGAV